MNEFISPFYVSLIDTSGGNYKFIVNAGDINSFILSTYKAKYKNILNKEEDILKVQEDDYYAVNLQKEKSFEFGKFNLCRASLQLVSSSLFDGNSLVFNEYVSNCRE